MLEINKTMNTAAATHLNEAQQSLIAALQSIHPELERVKRELSAASSELDFEQDAAQLQSIFGASDSLRELENLSVRAAVKIFEARRSAITQ